jgi:hypothetical protein
MSQRERIQHQPEREITHHLQDTVTVKLLLFVEAMVMVDDWFGFHGTTVEAGRFGVLMLTKVTDLF